MWSRSIILSALAVYLSVVGCAFLQTGEENDNAWSRFSRNDDDSPPAPLPLKKLAGLPYRGVAMQIQKVDKIEAYIKSIDEVAALGADTVSIVVDCRQENGASAKIFMDLRMTPSPERLAQLIRHAKSRNLRVVLMPIVLLDAPRGREWRGTIQPDRWDNWFDSYRQMMRHYAEVAEQNSVDLLVVGSELVSTESNLAEWTKTIRMIRRVFKGQITYSANWDHYRSVPFWDQLDLIGVNSYWNMGKVGSRTLDSDSITVETLQQRWAEIQEDLLAFQRAQGKPLVLLEVGWCSVSNAAHEPWDYTQSRRPLDVDLQRRLYEGFLHSWWGNPSLGGFIIWEWTLGEGGRSDRGYTPEGKPAEKLLREWFAKPPWEVNPGGGS